MRNEVKFFFSLYIPKCSITPDEKIETHSATAFTSFKPPNVVLLQNNERFENLLIGLHVIADGIGGTGATPGRRDQAQFHHVRHRQRLHLIELAVIENFEEFGYYDLHFAFPKEKTFDHEFVIQAASPVFYNGDAGVLASHANVLSGHDGFGFFIFRRSEISQVLRSILKVRIKRLPDAELSRRSMNVSLYGVNLFQLVESLHGMSFPMRGQSGANGTGGMRVHGSSKRLQLVAKSAKSVKQDVDWATSVGHGVQNAPHQEILLGNRGRCRRHCFVCLFFLC